MSRNNWKGLKAVDSLIGDALEDPILEVTKANRVFKRWPQIVGEALSKRSWPDRYDKGTVWVAVQGSAWAQELRLMKETILKRLRLEAGGENLFTDVRFGVRPLPAIAESVDVLSAEPERLGELSIREIAERRLKRWSDEQSD